MQIKVNEANRVVELWLTNAEKNDEKLKASLKPMYEKYKREKYRVALFLSGNRELFTQIDSLLIHNRNVLARQETERERKQSREIPVTL